MDMKSLTGLYLVLSLSAVSVLSECPTDTAKRAQQCFTDLARGVATVDDSNNRGNSNTNNNLDPGPGLPPGAQGPGSQGPGSQGVSGAMPLDYRKIREYCAEDGHMPRFVRCVEELSVQCPDLPPEGALQQLINPERVRTSVPNLCNNVDKVEASSECMNREMNTRSPCKERAYAMIKSGMTETAANNTAMFFIQCRFFSILAECQRTAVSEECGDNLGDLHADFLLSFVPNICLKNNDLSKGQGQDDDLHKKDSDFLNDVNRGGEQLQKKEGQDSEHKGQGQNKNIQGQGNKNDIAEEKTQGGGDKTFEESVQSVKDKSQNINKTPKKVPQQKPVNQKSGTTPHESDIYQQVLRTLPPNIALKEPVKTAASPKGSVPTINTMKKDSRSQESKLKSDGTSTDNSDQVAILSSGNRSEQGKLLVVVVCVVASLGSLLLLGNDEFV
ncbi:uncharacterized protein [Littorina saxatilis]|uniref:uncharacterized protein n=1 Tax=Littorina saxatilis TaxID=31220 RepID=UPI0038B6AFB0